MPELPEVEAARQLVEKYCQGHTIVDVIDIEQGGGPRSGVVDDIVLQSIADKDANIVAVLKGRKLNEVKRRGKYLYWTLDDNAKYHPVFHFGMTGSFLVKGKYQHIFHHV